MYEHNEDENDFDAFSKQLGLGEGLSINVATPVGETLVVSGVREVPTIISVVRNAQRDPKRDARMLASTLSTSLDPQTIYFLAEYLFAEHLSPILKELVPGKITPVQPKTEPIKPKAPKKAKEEKGPDAEFPDPE